MEGALDLQGTDLSPTPSTSDRSPEPIPGDWYGIRMTDTADNTFVLHDLVVEFGVLGIQGHEGSHQDVVDCTVRDTSVDGIYLEYGAGVRDILDPGLLVSGNTVERTGLHYAIKIERTGEERQLE